MGIKEYCSFSRGRGVEEVKSLTAKGAKGGVQRVAKDSFQYPLEGYAKTAKEEVRRVAKDSFQYPLEGYAKDAKEFILKKQGREDNAKRGSGRRSW